MTWDEFYKGMARYVSTKSKDPSTQCGAVIVGPDNEVRSIGYNGFPRGVDDDVSERWNRPEKYYWVAHAEANAIANAARVGIPVKGCKIYITHPPCADCAVLIANAGIIRAVWPEDFYFGHKRKWFESCKRAVDIFVEAGIGMSSFSFRI